MMFFDRTQRSVVAGCHQCGCREVFGSMAAADAWAMDHVNRAHPGPSIEHQRALTASRKRRERDTP